MRETKPKKRGFGPCFRTWAEANRISKKSRGLGQPIPKIAQNFLADLLDPPRGGGGDVKLVLKPNDRRRKLKRELQEFQKVVQIVAAMNRGKGVTVACEEVMPPGGGFRLMKPWREVLEKHPELVGWLLESFADFTDKKPPIVTDKK